MQIPNQEFAGIAIGALATLLFALMLFAILLFSRRSRYRFMKYSKLSKFFPWNEALIREFVLNAVAEAERRYGIYLSRAGREMLIAPIEEAFESTPTNFDFGLTRESIFILFDAMSFESKMAKKDTYPRLHNSQSVVRAFHERFCKIPPFCDGRGE